ncbi:hypothetical protein UFOVP9_5 [uncultured Caudovirales phage]|jgi:N4-gp56 family major capsid protein|uniref:Uncharacterized protein n=1 Tax=uncultured Caudovirales phage TaxID=2100421 RepID=A0A6J5KI95_9CAUD|nr:hypothetical protein UFOVP9_5 [uncultured Caudovirales phage]
MTYPPQGSNKLNFIHNICAMQKNMPANGGTKLRMSRFNPLATAMTPLGNTGVTPPGQNLTRLDLDAELSFYGTFVSINEQVQLQNQNPVLNEAAARLGVSLRQTEDQLTRDMLASTASFLNCVGGASSDSPTEISRADINDVIATLLSNNAFTITDGIEGEDRFGSSPVRNSFMALCNTALIPDLENVNGMTNNWNYPSVNRTIPSEWCAVANLRFLISSIGSATLQASAMNQTVYNIFCTGLEAYANVNQDRYSAQFIYLPPVFSGPLALNASVGYKFATCPKITNDLWILNLRATLAA